ncbi:MAG: type II toxin-antitoxin system RelE/ParE family toxin [Deltaproteobacteria bacterium]
MKFRFASRRLHALYTRGAGARRYPPQVVDGFFEVLRIIDAAAGMSDIYAFKSLHFEKLSGDRSGQRSLRLGRQWRLIVTVDVELERPEIIVEEIVDYH